MGGLGEDPTVALSVILFAVSGSIENLYAFHFTAIDDWNKSFGWDMYDIQSEYMRMGAPSENWTLTNLNKFYEVIMPL